MADKEEVVFSLKVEQSDALTEMERFKKSILQTKQEQQELTKAYKQGNITLDEFVQDSVRLESILKKQQSSYNNVQKSVTGVKTQLDKLIDSNKKISKSFEDTAKEINVAGFNMGDLTAKMSAFANPATAAVGLVTALGTAYANSTIGARDFKNAQDQLTTALTLSSNSFAEFIDGLAGGDGSGKDGILSRLAFAVNQGVFGTNTAILSKFAADTKRILQEIEIDEFDSKARAKDALKVAEELRRTRDREDLDLQSRMSAANSVQEFIDKRERELVDIQNRKLSALNDLLVLDKENLELKKLIKQVEFEIADIQEDSEGKRTEALNGIIALEKEANKPRDAAGGRKLQFIPGQSDADGVRQEKETQDAILAIQVNAADKQIETHAMTEDEKTRLERQGIANRLALAEEERKGKLLIASTLFGGLAGIMDEGTAAQKALALASIGINTGEAISALVAYAAENPLNGPTFGIAGALQYATHLATILSNIATAKSYVTGFADGGWTGPGSKYQPAGIVHADEYVAPKHIVHSAAAQPHLAALESMRLRGYADGGLVTNSLTAGVNQNLMIANMMKHMPRPVLEMREVARRLEALEISTVADKPFRK